MSERIDTETGEFVYELRFRPLLDQVTQASSGPVAQVLTIAQAAAVLGVSRATFFKLLRSDIPRVMVGGSVRVLRKDLDAYLERQRVAVLPAPLRRSA